MNEIHYRNLKGRLLWKDDYVFRRMWGVGNEIIHNYVKYIVRHVAIVDDVQHVNLELWKDLEQENE
jgi:hypothetical protein